MNMNSVLYKINYRNEMYMAEIRNESGLYYSAIAMSNYVPKDDDVFFPSGTIYKYDLTVLSGILFQVTVFPPYRSMKRIRTIPTGYARIIQAAAGGPVTNTLLEKEIGEWVEERRRRGW